MSVSKPRLGQTMAEIGRHEQRLAMTPKLKPIIEGAPISSKVRYPRRFKKRAVSPSR